MTKKEKKKKHRWILKIHHGLEADSFTFILQAALVRA